MRIKGTTVAIAAVAVLVGYGVVSMVWPGEAADTGDPMAQGPAGAKSANRDDRRSGGHQSAGAGGPARRTPPPLAKLVQPNNFASDEPEFEAPRPGGDPNAPTPEEAREIFDASLAELDGVIDGELELTLREEQQLYGRLTGSFEVLSAHISKNNPEQKAYLEEAYAEMIQKLREAEVVPSRPGARERPQRDPDRHRRHRARGRG